MPSRSGSQALSTRRQHRPRVGMLWGDFPWDAPPPKVGKLYSMGAVARNVTRALSMIGRVVPFLSPDDPSPAAQRAALEAFLRSIDVLWADVYPGTEPALRLRSELELSCPAILFAGGAMPKGAEAMLFPWRSLLRSGDGLLFTCHADRAIWRQLVRRSTLREWVVPLAVDTTVFYPRPPDERAAMRARLGVPLEMPLLLYVGRLNIQKNLHSLLRLLAMVRRDVPGTTLCLVGEEDDIVLGEFRVANTGYGDWLRTLAADLGVADAVRFVGPKFGEELAQAYAAADVLVNASFYHRESFGLSPAEAQACGLPVVCTAWGGFKDVVRDGETGYLLEAVLTKHGIRVDWATGAWSVVELLQDPARRERMSEKAAAHAHRQFSIRALAQALAAVVAEAGQPPADPSGLRQAYEPSAFARRFEAHKRDCGWYAVPSWPAAGAFQQDGISSPPPWYPPMFQGRDYALYETLMQPYATRLAHDLPPGRVDPAWVPYCPSGVELDPVRRMARDLDPVWPHRRFLTPVEWEILRRVDGTASVGQISAAVAATHPMIDEDPMTGCWWILHSEGFVLFQATDPGLVL